MLFSRRLVRILSKAMAMSHSWAGGLGVMHRVEGVKSIVPYRYVTACYGPEYKG